MCGTILRRKRKPRSANTVIESYRFVEAQQTYEIIYYEIMEKNMSKKDNGERKHKIDEFVLKTTCSSTRARKIN